MPKFSYRRYAPALLALLVFFVSGPIESQNLYINEVLASNKTDKQDEDGEHNDWIELYNAGSTAINLGGFTITDDETIPGQWALPDLTLDAGSYLLLWASGKDKSANELHTNFKLKAGGEFIAIYDQTGAEVDAFDFDAQTADISYGRLPDGSDTFAFFTETTPGSANESSPPPDGTITFSHQEGVYGASIDVVLTGTEPGASVHYTTDGAPPTSNSSVYTGALHLSSSKVVRAILYKNGEKASAIFTRTYIVDENPKLPVLSLALDPDDLWDENTGIYKNFEGRGDAWERSMHLALIENNKTEFAIQGGVRIHGNYTRRLDKKSFRLYFRSEYGESKLNYNLFPDKGISKFKRLVLHAGGSDQPTDRDSWSHIRNPLAVQMWKEAGFSKNVSMYKPVALYLNGEYWGLYWIRERVDKNFVESNFGYTNMDLQKEIRDTHVPEVEEGDDGHWLELWNFFKNNDISTPENYAIVKEKYFNIVNYAQYHLIEIFAGNFDWPHNNIYRLRNRGGSGRFSHILWDTDQAFNLIGSADHSHATLKWASRDEPRPDLQFREPGDGSWLWSTFILRRLFENDEFVALFCNQYADFLNTIFDDGNLGSMARKIEASIEDEMPREMKRWGVSDQGTWRRNIDRVHRFLQYRDTEMASQIANRFQLGGLAKLTLTPSTGPGTVQINSLKPTLPWTGTYFEDNPITLKAIPDPGHSFAGWSDPNLPQTPTVELVLKGDHSVHAIFGEAGGTPVISAVAASPVLDKSATITWQTSTGATSVVEYGTDENLGNTVTDTLFVIAHTVQLERLTPSTTYFFRVSSVSSTGEQTVSTISSFTTRAESVFSHRINVGSAYETTSGGNIWLADKPYSAGSYGYTGTNIGHSSTEDPIAGTDDDLPYQTNIYRVKSYRVALPQNGNFTVRLHFAETYYKEAGRRIFDVSLEDQLVLPALDVVSHAGHDVAAVFDFEVTINDGILDIDFGRVLENPIISAVEIGAVPTGPDEQAPQISNIQISEITTESARISWQTNEAATTQLAWGVSSSYGNLTTLENNNVQQHSVVLTDLTPNTVYHFQALSEDAAGNAGRSDDQSFSTFPIDETGPTVSNVVVSAVTPTTAIISFQSNEPGHSQIEYGLNTSYGAKTAFSTTLSTAHQHILSGLTANAAYHFRVIARDEQGNLSTSGDFSFTTQAVSIFTQRMNVGGEAYTGTDGREWAADRVYEKGSFGYLGNNIGTSVEMDSIAGTEDDILYQTSHYRVSAVRFTVPENGLYLVQLHFAETYYKEPGKRIFNVLIEDQMIHPGLDVFNEVGHDSAFVSIHEVEVTDGIVDIDFTRILENPSICAVEVVSVDPTIDETAPVLSNISAASVSVTTATIKWQTNEPADAKVEFGTDAHYGSSVGPNGTNATTHSIDLSDLQANTTYHYRVISKDAAANEARSSDLTFTTLAQDETPPVISNVEITAITATGAEVSWETNEAATSKLEYGEDTDYGKIAGDDNKLATSRKVSLSSLQPNTTYHLRVVATDPSGNSTVGSDLTFTTQEAAAFAKYINVGGDSFTGSDGTHWESDQPYTPGSHGYVGNRVGNGSTDGSIADTDDDFIYQTDRYRIDAYRITVPQSGRYLVTLHFAENYYEAVNKRIFGVSLEDKKVIHSMDIFEMAGYNAALIFDFETDISDGILDIDFHRIKENMKINAINIMLIEGGTLARRAEQPQQEVVADAVIPEAFSLSQNYPNPFNIETRFQLDLPQPGTVTARIYAVNGQEITVLAHSYLPAGQLHLEWNGRNSRGHEIGSGIYILKVVFTADDGSSYRKTRRLTLLK